MQKEFNKLTIQKKQKFIVKNLLKDDYFIKVHDKIKTLFIEDVYTKAEQIQQILIKNEKMLNKITYILTNYTDNIIDLYCYPTSDYFYNQVMRYKNKLYKIFDLNILNYKDDNEFKIHQLILDTWIITREMLVRPEIGIGDIISRIPDYVND
jgi:hypothetical protein